MHSWRNGYNHWKWTGRPEFTSWTRLFAIPTSNSLEKGLNLIILPLSVIKKRGKLWPLSFMR